MKTISVKGQEVTFYEWQCPYCGTFDEDNTDEMRYPDNPSKIECDNCEETYEIYFGDTI